MKGVPSILGLVGLDLVLSALAGSAVLRVVANDHPTSPERILAWISIAALPILLLTLIALLVRASRIANFFGVAEREP